MATPACGGAVLACTTATAAAPARRQPRTTYTRPSCRGACWAASVPVRLRRVGGVLRRRPFAPFALSPLALILDPAPGLCIPSASSSAPRPSARPPARPPRARPPCPPLLSTPWPEGDGRATRGGHDHGDTARGAEPRVPRHGQEGQGRAGPRRRRLPRGHSFEASASSPENEHAWSHAADRSPVFRLGPR
eukprot:9491811-Pyramimonas_sp.AAC.2